MKGRFLLIPLLAWTAAQRADAEGPEAAWLERAPANAQVIVRISGIDAAKDRLFRFLDVFSQSLAPRAKDALNKALAPIADPSAKGIVDTSGPMLIVMRIDRVENALEGVPLHYAAMFRTRDFPKVLKSITQGPEADKPGPEGFFSLKDSVGNLVHAFDAGPFAAVSNDREIMLSIVKGADNLSASMTKAEREILLAHDLGIRINTKELIERFPEPVDQFSAKGFEVVDRVTGGALPKRYLERIRETSSAWIAGLRSSRAFTANFDFAPDALAIEGLLTYQSEKPAAESSSRAVATSELLEDLPADMTYYLRMNRATARSFKALVSLTMFGKEDAAAGADSGLSESAAAYETGAGQSCFVTLARHENAEKAIAGFAAGIAGLKDPQTAAAALVAEAKLDPAPHAYRGAKFKGADIAFDYSGYSRSGRILWTQLTGARKSIRIGETGRSLLTVGAIDEPTADRRIATVLSGQDTLGKIEAFRRLKAKLPERTDAVLVLRVQGLALQLGRLIMAIDPASASGRGAFKMPAEPALVGFAKTAQGNDSRIRIVIPTSSGPAIEQGLLPTIMTLASPRPKQ